MKRIKEPVRLRGRKLADGNESLYLDIYSNGKRRYEFLKLYLVPEKTPEDRRRNSETMRVATVAKARLVAEIQGKAHGVEVARRKVRFFDYYRSLMEDPEAKMSSSRRSNWNAALRHLEAYEPDRGIDIARIDAAWVEGFRTWLETKACHHLTGQPISEFTRHGYFVRLKACLHQAVRDGVIARDPSVSVKAPSAPESERCFLTLDELRRLTATPAPHEGMRRAFLFSCLTGIRWSDLKKMTWGEVSDFNGRRRVTFRQKKTKGLLYLDLSAQAAALMGDMEGHGKEELVFADMPNNCNTNIRLRQWTEAAGIAKPVTFHCGRHTFAVTMIERGADIYTVSKLLGHHSITVTQVYAKIVDDMKRNAVDSFPSIF